MKDSTGIKSEAKNAKPASGTEEWADWNMNFSKGCPRNCRYCYAKSMAIRFGRHTKDSWQNEIITFDDSKKFHKKYERIAMIPSSHDITPGNLSAAIKAIGGLLEAGNDLIIVSKPNLECIEALCSNFDAYKDQIRFRFSIGSMNNDILSFWEPNAPSFEERFYSLFYAYENGYNTGVSMEPFLDNQVEETVATLRDFVSDTIWIGKATKLRTYLSLNGYKNDEVTQQKASELLELYDSNYKFELYDKFKNDPIIRWKDSLKEDLKLERPTKKGLNI